MAKAKKDGGQAPMAKAAKAAIPAAPTSECIECVDEMLKSDEVAALDPSTRTQVNRLLSEVKGIFEPDVVRS